MSSCNEQSKRIFVVGVGMTPFTKPGTQSLAIDYPDLVEEAVNKALTDAAISYEQIQFAATGYVFGDSTSGQRSLYRLGMTGIPIVNVNNNCATGSTALFVAANALLGSQYECALAVGFEKMEKGALGTKFKDRVSPLDKHVDLLMELEGIAPAPITAQLFGAAGKEHMKRYQTTETHYAKIAAKNLQHAVNNPNAQLNGTNNLLTVSDVLNTAQVYDFLTRAQCCPTSNGAACAVLATEHFVRKHRLEAQAVEILAIEMRTDFRSTLDEKSAIKLIGYDMTAAAAEAAYKRAKIGPQDLDVIELHDCFSCNELITYEALGLCGKGEAKNLVDSGDNTYGGKFVINPSGGLLAKGHPLGATGVAQCVELCWQLRGIADKRQVPNARIALQHNIGIGGAVVVALYRLLMQKRPKVADGEFDLEKARHEVFMVGIKGLSHKDKREAKRELAIRLGATPKKKRGKNIKQHLDELREQKRKEQEEREQQLLMGGDLMKTKVRKESKKPKKKGLNEVRGMDYQVGRYKNGVQFLSKEDIERIKSKR